MPFPEPPRREPADVPADAWVRPDPLDLTFEGFSPEAFEALERLREHPRIEQYRADKAVLRRAVQDPFKQYRDDLVVNWVLPNRLAFETEKNIFSRILKNDFGAGGSHHHLWMAFYRPGRKRLTDLQVSHSIDPDGFRVGLYVGDYAKEPLARAQRNVAADPATFLAALNPLLARDGWRFATYRRNERTVYEAPLDDVPDDLGRADALWARRTFARDDALAWGGRLVEHSLDAVARLWPLYRLFAR